MSKETIEMLVEGGKATPGPDMGQKLGPLKIPIPDVLKSINEKTAAFEGVKVPVKLIVDTETKEYDIEVGTPPVSELIKKELGIDKGSGTPDKMKVGNAGIENLIKVAKMKMESMYTDNLKAAVRSVAGSCQALGILVEGKLAPAFNKELEEGKYDKEIQEEKTEVSPEKVAMLKEQFEAVQTELKAELEKAAAAAAPVAEEKPEEGEKKEETKPEATKKPEAKK